MANLLSVGLVLLVLHGCASFSPTLAPLRRGSAPRIAPTPGKRAAWRAVPAVLGLRGSGEGGAGDWGEEARAEAANKRFELKRIAGLKYGRGDAQSGDEAPVEIWGLGGSGRMPGSASE
ncbi:hypothetical protein T484DRAFT_1772668 [Baffinella frigidus]|nr:hypothetical protein T484DRAFT_1772668 [Cryptophyta sp. CCMP2293]